MLLEKNASSFYQPPFLPPFPSCILKANTHRYETNRLVCTHYMCTRVVVSDVWLAYMQLNLTIFSTIP